MRLFDLCVDTGQAAHVAPVTQIATLARYDRLAPSLADSDQLLTARSSISEWGTVFADPRLVAAIVDRITFKAHILETGTQSYWLRTSKNSSSRKTSQTNPHPSVSIHR